MYRRFSKERSRPSDVIFSRFLREGRADWFCLAVWIQWVPSSPRTAATKEESLHRHICSIPSSDLGPHCCLNRFDVSGGVLIRKTDREGCNLWEGPILPRLHPYFAGKIYKLTLVSAPYFISYTHGFFRNPDRKCSNRVNIFQKPREEKLYILDRVEPHKILCICL